MARLYRVTAEVALSASTLTYLAQLHTSADTDLRVTALDVTFNQVYSTSLPLVELTKDAGAATGSSFTALKWNGEAQNFAANTTVLTVITVAPSTPVVQSSWQVGGFLDKYPLGREPYLLASAYYSLRVNSPLAGSVSINIEFEE